MFDLQHQNIARRQSYRRSARLYSQSLSMGDCDHCLPEAMEPQVPFSDTNELDFMIQATTQRSVGD